MVIRVNSRRRLLILCLMIVDFFLIALPLAIKVSQ